jgi:hypothetical protein
MNWDAIGAVGEIAGATGVIISLIYLATQIKNQSRDARLTAVNNMTSQWNSFMGDMTTNTELARVWAKGVVDFDSLNPTERVMLSTHFSRILRITESMFHQHQGGLLDDKIWLGIRRSITDFISSPGVRIWWPTRKHWFSDEYGAFIQEEIDGSQMPGLSYGGPSDETDEEKGNENPPPDKTINSDA